MCAEYDPAGHRLHDSAGLAGQAGSLEPNTAAASAAASALLTTTLVACGAAVTAVLLRWRLVGTTSLGAAGDAFLPGDVETSRE
ncbi:MAG: hypothetical protein WDW36_002739 [Sanguina aurantia]